MRDYEIEVRIRNGRIKTAMRAAGYKDVAALARAMGAGGMKGGVTPIYDLVNMKATPLKENGDWRQIVYDMSSALHCEPEHLFSARQMEGFEKTEYLMEISEEEALSQVGAPDTLVFRREIMEKLETLLPVKLAQAVIQSFGLDGQGERTFEEVARASGITRERARQRVAEGLRLLGRPVHRHVFGGKPT